MIPCTIRANNPNAILIGSVVFAQLTTEHPYTVTGQLADMPTPGLPTAQFVDWTSRELNSLRTSRHGLDNSRTGHHADNAAKSSS